MPNFYIEAAIDPTQDDDAELQALLGSLSPYPMLSSIDGVQTLSAEVEARTEQQATNQFRTAAERAGLRLRRFLPDLVNIQEIARRTTASPETVRTWVRGERRHGFPAHMFVVGRKQVWHWLEVLTWIKETVGTRVEVDDLYDYYALSMACIDQANAQIHAATETATKDDAAEDDWDHRHTFEASVPHWEAQLRTTRYKVMTV